MLNTIKPIETEWNGYRFRSRCEARWAVFLNSMRCKFEYEHEGYDIAGEWYLPDFWIPSTNTIIEVKGVFPTEGELKKLRLLSEHSGFDCFVVYGNPGNSYGMLYASSGTPDDPEFCFLYARFMEFDHECNSLHAAVMWNQESLHDGWLDWDLSTFVYEVPISGCRTEGCVCYEFPRRETKRQLMHARGYRF